MQSKVEHMNITVGNLDNTLNFLQTAMPDFVVRGEGDSESNNKSYHWVHFGTDESYVALQAFTGRSKMTNERYSDVGGNHIGFVVEDIETLITRMEQKGFMPSSENQDHPFRRRVYFETNDGLEWEFIQYSGDSVQQNNDYSI